MSHVMREAGGIFGHFHAEIVGESVDFEALDVSDVEPELLEEARQVWRERARTEFRSTQIMARFLQEVLGSGDPVDVYAGALDLVEDEVHHTVLCAGMCRALGVEPVFPDPVALDDPPDFLKAPMPERALHTAIRMVAINETISFWFIEDLRRRCRRPVVRDVLEATLADEEDHQDFGWIYIEQSLGRFPESTLPDWRTLVRETLRPHVETARAILREIPVDDRHIEAFPDEERIELGLFGPQRQALVFWRTLRDELAPRLLELDLLDERPPPVEVVGRGVEAPGSS
jgi:hypothetical protein